MIPTLPPALIKPLLYVGAVAAVLLALWAWGNHREAQGRSACETAYKAAALAEKQRQATANEAAQRASHEVITRLNTEKDKLEAQLNANAASAARDPDRDRCALSPDGVRRIDSIH